MIAEWNRWVAFTRQPVDSRPLVVLRTLVPLMVLFDMASIYLRNAQDAVLYPTSMGGMVQRSDAWFLLESVPHAGPLLVGVVSACMALAVVGVLTRPALVVGVVAYAQLGHMWTAGDRGIDRILRTAMVILIFSAVTNAKVPRRIPRWSVDLIRLLVVCVFIGAAVAKANNNGHHWLGMMHPHELYTIMASPINGRLDPVFWYDIQAPFIAMGWATLILEFAVVLVFTRFGPWWAISGALMHLGIAATMDLGIFSWGMLALYPVLFSPWTEALLDRWAPNWLPDEYPPR